MQAVLFNIWSRSYNFNIATMSYAITVFNEQTPCLGPFPVAGKTTNPVPKRMLSWNGRGAPQGVFPDLPGRTAGGVFLEDKYVFNGGTMAVNLSVEG